MDRYELLVHVTAPGTVRDDARYRAIAQAIRDFESVAIIKLTRDDVYEREDACEQAIELSNSTRASSQHPASLPTESPKTRMLATCETRSGQPSVTYVSSSKRRWKTNPKASEQPEGVSRPMANPPYEHPLHGLTGGAAHVRYMQTLNLERPRTAPETSPPRVLVPFTDRPLRKRAYSACSSFNDLSTMISDSQPPNVLRAPSAFHTALFEHVKSSESEPTCDEQVAHSSSREGPDPANQIPPTKRCRLTTVESDKFLPTVVEGERSKAGTEEGIFGCERSLDWMSSAPSMPAPSRGSLPSTLSPSQSISPTLFAGANHRRSPVDLTSPRNNTSSTQHGVMRSSPSPTTRRAHTQDRKTPADSPNPALPDSSAACAPFPNISRLSSEINCPNPPTSYSAFDTHVTPALQFITDRLPLAKNFRPKMVLRDVNVLERGYWRLLLAVAAPAVAIKARQSPHKPELLEARGSELRGASAAERLPKWQESTGLSTRNTVPAGDIPSRQCPWSEQEFTSFWSNLTTYIKDGKAGWGIRVSKEVVETAGTDGETLRLQVKVFTWGELIGHIWVLLWVLSDKLVSYIPMEWIAGDETVVVRMTGERYQQGRLGPWIRKGLPGERGCCGTG